MGHQTRLRLNDHPPLTFILRYRSPGALYHPFRHQNPGRCLRKHHLYPYQIQRQHRQRTAYLSSDFNLSSLQAICPPHPHVASRLLHLPGLGQRLKIRQDTRIRASSPLTYSGTGSSLGSREDEDEDEEVDDEDNGEDVSSLSDASFHTATATIDSLDDDERLGEPDDDHGDEDEQAGNSTQVGVDNKRPLFLHHLPRPEATRWSSISLLHHDYEGSGSEDPSLPSSNAASADHCCYHDHDRQPR